MNSDCARLSLPLRQRQALPAQCKAAAGAEHLTSVTTMFREMGMELWLTQADAEMAVFR